MLQFFTFTLQKIMTYLIVGTVIFVGFCFGFGPSNDCSCWYLILLLLGQSVSIMFLFHSRRLQPVVEASTLSSPLPSPPPLLSPPQPPSHLLPSHTLPTPPQPPTLSPSRQCNSAMLLLILGAPPCIQQLLKLKWSGLIRPHAPVLRAPLSEVLAEGPPPLLPASPTGAHPAVGQCATLPTPLHVTRPVAHTEGHHELHHTTRHTPPHVTQHMGHLPLLSL